VRAHAGELGADAVLGWLADADRAQLSHALAGSRAVGRELAALDWVADLAAMALGTCQDPPRPELMQRLRADAAAIVAGRKRPDGATNSSAAAAPTVAAAARSAPRGPTSPPPSPS
jgi:hypothetical protein